MAIKLVKIEDVTPTNLTSFSYRGRAVIDSGRNGVGSTKTIDFLVQFNRIYLPYSGTFDSMPEYPNHQLNGRGEFVSPVKWVIPFGYGDELAFMVREYFNKQARNQYSKS